MKYETSDMTLGSGPACRWSAARVIVLVNFLLITLGLALDRVGGRALDSALRNAGVDNIFDLSLQLWLASSTLLATGFYAWALHTRHHVGPKPDRIRRSLAIDGGLLLAWWLTVLGACMYAFMLGMGG